MNVLISSALSSHEEFIITILATQLINRGFTPQISVTTLELSDLTKHQLITADIVVGIMTQGSDTVSIEKEWLFALKHNKQTLFLIEYGVNIAIELADDYILFERNSIELVVGQLISKAAALRQKGVNHLNTAVDILVRDAVAEWVRCLIANSGLH